jgi:hypothetical protein
LFRSVANAGYAVGAGIAAIGLSFGTVDAYRTLILLNALSYLGAALLVRLTSPTPGVSSHVEEVVQQGPSPWRDRGYLLFVLIDIAMNLDDAVLNVGLPLWLIHHTRAPQTLVPAFLILNTVLVVLLQLRFSTWASRTPLRAATCLPLYGVAMLACCLLLALTAGASPWTATLALLAAAALTTFAELLRSISSWELAVSLAPTQSRASYLGVAGMAQSIEKAAGPLLLTGVVMTAGPVGWAALGVGLVGAGVVQRRGCVRRLGAMGTVTVAEEVAVGA